MSVILFWVKQLLFFKGKKHVSPAVFGLELESFFYNK